METSNQTALMTADYFAAATVTLVKTKFEPKYETQTRRNPAMIGRNNQLVIDPTDAGLPVVDLIPKNSKALGRYTAAIDLSFVSNMDYETLESLLDSRAYLQLPQTGYSAAGIAAVKQTLRAMIQPMDPDRDPEFRDGRFVLPDLMSDSAVLAFRYSKLSKDELRETFAVDLTFRFVDFDYESQLCVRHTPDAVHEFGVIRSEFRPYDFGARTAADLLKMIESPSWQKVLRAAADS